MTFLAHAVETKCERCGRIYRKYTAVTMSVRHRCPDERIPSLRVYTEEEKREFERKRKAGLI